MLPEPSTLAWQAAGEWLEESSIALLKSVLLDRVCGRVALVSSFGAEAAVLLHLASRVDRAVPVIFLDTQMMFAETLNYQRELADHLGLADVRVITPDQSDIKARDRDAKLHRQEPDQCCHIRKTVPLNRALAGFDGWINGRKRHQTSQRSAIKPIETDAGGLVRINPLLHWMADDIENYFEIHDLPRHPMVKDGWTSIGCAPCTVKPINPDDPRSGRWAGSDKTECGIHIENGRIVRPTARQNGVHEFA